MRSTPKIKQDSNPSSTHLASDNKRSMPYLSPLNIGNRLYLKPRYLFSTCSIEVSGGRCVRIHGRRGKIIYLFNIGGINIFPRCCNGPPDLCFWGKRTLAFALFFETTLDFSFFFEVTHGKCFRRCGFTPP